MPDSNRPCPHCGGSEIFRSHRRNAVERYLLRAIGVRPFRCVNCDARFLSAQALRWLPNTGRQSDLTNSSSVFRKKSDHALRRFPERHPLRLLHVTVNEDRQLLPLNSDLLWLRCLAWLAGAEVRSLKVFFSAACEGRPEPIPRFFRNKRAGRHNFSRLSRTKTPKISRPRWRGNRYSCGFFHGRKNIE